MPDYTPVTDVEVEDVLEVLEYVARESIKAERAHKVVERMHQELGDLRGVQQPCRPDMDMPQREGYNWAIVEHVVGHGRQCDAVRRLPVPGGWLYQVNNGGPWHPPVFVPR